MKITFNSTHYNDADKSTFLTYTLNNNLQGSAAGVITVEYTVPQTLRVCWANEELMPLCIRSGEKILKYSPLFVFDGDDSGFFSYKVLDFTAIPVGAKNLILVNSDNEVLCYIVLPSFKLLPVQNPKYCFGVIADIHYNYFFNHDKTVDYAVDAIDRALDFYKKAGVCHVCGAGDYGIYSEEKSYQDFSNAIQKSGVKVISCGGNHELYAKLDVMYSENGIWRTYMNKGIYDGSDSGVLDIAANGIDFTYMIPNQENEVFVFLSQRYWDGHTSKQPMLLDPDQLIWLENQFETYRNKTIFLLFHTYLSDDDGENVDGEGDLKSTGGYSYNGHYNTYTPDEKILRGLFEKYRNVIWFNGHSHYEYCMQVYNENLNIFDYQGTTCTMIHVPSVTNPRTVKPDATHYSSLRGTSSQGALQFVYDGFHIMNGMELWTDEIQSYACSIIYTNKEDITKDFTTDNRIKSTYDAQTCSLRILGKGKLSHRDIEPLLEYRDNIYSLYIGKGITDIEDGMFRDLVNLTSIEIKEGVEYIGRHAFSCAFLKRLILPETLCHIGSDAFSSDNIDELIFDGTEERFRKIEIEDGNSSLVAKSVTYRKAVIGFDIEGKAYFFDVPMGKIPSFDDIPVKEHSDDNKYYVFIGWKDEKELYPCDAPLPSATKNIIYRAVFGADGERYVSGSYENINWTLDRKKSTLTVCGNGEIPDFEELEKRPWDIYKNSIAKLIVSSGISHVGANAFKQLPALKTAIIEEGVLTIGKDGLAYNKLLHTVHIPKSLKDLGRGAVYSSDFIEKVYYGGTREEWKAFCNGITSYYNTNLTNTKDVECLLS